MDWGNVMSESLKGKPFKRCLPRRLNVRVKVLPGGFSRSLFDPFPLLSSAATGPSRQAGRPLQGRGVPHRHPPMAGTWAPIERGVTASSSECFKGTPSPRCFRPLGKAMIIPAASLRPRRLHLCIRNTDSLFLTLLCTLSLSFFFSMPCTPHSPSHTPTALCTQPPVCRRGLSFFFFFF